MPTVVISVRGQSREELLRRPDFIYVGRAVPRASWTASIWGNPFHEGMDPFAAQRIFASVPHNDIRRGGVIYVDGPFTRQDAVKWFEAYVKWRRELFSRLCELQGKTLGCWCGCWGPGEPEIACHAVVLARLADGGGS